MANKVKTYIYKITLRKKVEEVVSVEATTAHVDNRGNLCLAIGPASYTPSFVAAFCAGSWLSFSREEKC